MKIGNNLAIGVSVSVLVAVIVTLVLYGNSNAGTIPSEPSYTNSSTSFTFDEQKARALAESSVDELRTGTYGCHFDSSSGVFDEKSNLQYIRLGYNCDKYIGSFVILEDSQLTRIINVTTYPITRFGP